MMVQKIKQVPICVYDFVLAIQKIITVELIQDLGRRATYISGDSKETTYLSFPAVISGFAKGELTLSRFRTRSQSANMLQPVINFP